MDITARDLKFLALGAVASIGLTTLITSQYHGNLHQPCRIIDSPLPYIRKNLTKQQQDRLHYAPDALGGARDVATPFGSIRVYEWGPEDGRKTSLDEASHQPLIPIPNHKTLVGYSLGGGVAASFTSYFPNLVESLILIAPAGLMRPNHIHWTSRFLYGGFLPGKLVEYLIWRRLGGGSSSTPSRSNEDDGKITPTQAADEETPSHPALTRDSSASISTRRPSVSIADVVSWQLTHHAGFIPSFISSIQHAPVSNQHSSWKTIATNQSCPSPQQRLLEKKVLLLLGRDDNVIIADELSEDAKAVLGDAVDICILDGGHELPVINADIVAQRIAEFWNQ
ncbi:putative alpha/beta hydrolase [Aureobasidium pullulans]|nr:putative alpha/beta hydrolase [Aureobasidium pullulans]THX67056.1 putative alpha/beta hydrolase [Aureobasidium pullulans]